MKVRGLALYADACFDCCGSCVIYLYMASVLPAIHNLSSWQGIGHLCIAGWLAFNVFFNYLCCIFTDPGNSPHLSVRLQYPPTSSFWCYLRLSMEGTDIHEPDVLRMQWWRPFLGQPDTDWTWKVLVNLRPDGANDVSISSHLPPVKAAFDCIEPAFPNWLDTYCISQEINSIRKMSMLKYSDSQSFLNPGCS